MSHVGNVVELAAWRADRPRAHAVNWVGGGGRAARSRRATASAVTGWHPSFGGAPDSPDAGPDGTDERFAIGRLERAVGRLDRLAETVLRTRGALAPDVETELFAVIGQVQMGLVSDAADRAERLADRLGIARARSR
jgi:hypothetical protein